jgi:hypothetical protein
VFSTSQTAVALGISGAFDMGVSSRTYFKTWARCRLAPASWNEARREQIVGILLFI